jgi:hypothetical protein
MFSGWTQRVAWAIEHGGSIIMNECHGFLKEFSLVEKSRGSGLFGPPIVYHAKKECIHSKGILVLKNNQIPYIYTIFDNSRVVYGNIPQAINHENNWVCRLKRFQPGHHPDSHPSHMTHDGNSHIYKVCLKPPPLPLFRTILRDQIHQNCKGHVI